MGEKQPGIALRTRAANASRVGTHARRHLVAFAALFIALSGSAYAAGDVGPRDIAKGAVKAKHIAKKAVRAKHIRKNSVFTKHVKKGGLRTNDVRGLDKDLKKLSDGLIITGGYIGQLQTDIASLTTRVSSLESKNGSLEQSLNSLQADVQAMSAELKTVTGPGGSLAAMDQRADALEAGATAMDQRVDSLCTEADANNQETRDMRDALAAANILGLNLSGVSLPDYNPAACQG